MKYIIEKDIDSIKFGDQYFIDSGFNLQKPEDAMKAKLSKVQEKIEEKFNKVEDKGLIEEKMIEVISDVVVSKKKKSK